MTNASPTSRATRNTWLLLAALAAALFLILWMRPLESLFHQAATSHAGVGKPIPSIALTPLTVDASPINLAELPGKVALASFWGTWCPPCRKELPHLVEISNSLARDDFRLVAISCGGGEEDGELRTTTVAYLSATNLRIPAYADPGGKLREGLQKLGAFNDFFPTTLAVDRHGVIRAVWEGYLPGSEREMERVVTSLLVER